MKKRFISMLLALAMCLSLMPLPVGAAETGSTGSGSDQFTGITVLDQSGELSGEEAVKAFDGSTSTKWCDDHTDDKGWLAFQLAKPGKVTSMKVYHASSSSTDPKACNTLRFALQILKDPGAYESAANQKSFLADDANWDTLVDVNNSAQEPITDTPVSGAPMASIYRLNVTDGDNRTQWLAVRVHEIELYGKTELTDPVTVTFAPGVPAEGVPVQNTMEPEQTEKGEGYRLPDCLYTAEGWYFSGWQVGEEPEIQQPGASVVVSADVTVTAQWEKAVVATFAPGACGEQTPAGAMPSKSVQSGTEITLPDCTFEAPADWYFSGWKVGENSALKQPQEKITLSGDVTVTAQWIPAAEVTFVPGTAGELPPVGEVPAQKVKPGTDVTLPDCAFEADGWSFVGWLVGDETAEKKPGDKITVNDSVTVTAKWVQSAVASFAAGQAGETVPGGTTDRIAVIPGTEIVLPDSGFDKPAGYLFDGWTLPENETVYQAGSRFKLDSSVEFTAKWVKSHLLTFAPGTTGTGAVPSGEMLPKEAKEARDYVLPACGYQAEGYRFIGWSVVMGGAEAVTKKTGEAITVTADATLTALWSVEHKHGTENRSYTPLDPETGLDNNETQYFFAPSDMAITMTPDVRSKTFYLCLNNKALTGTLLLGKDKDGRVLDPHSKAGGSITAADAPAVQFTPNQSGGTFTLENGTLRRTGESTGPVVDLSQRTGGRFNLYGGLVDQTGSAPAILVHAKDNSLDLSSGTIRTAGGPAVELLTDAAHPENNTSMIYLSGVMKLEVPAGSAHIKVGSPERIDADGPWASIPYLGDVLTIDCAGLQPGDVVVTDVCDENWARFETLDPATKLERSGSKLILVKAEAARRTISFDTGAGGTVLKPEKRYDDDSFQLPGAKDVSRPGYGLVGWEYQGQTYLPEAMFTVPSQDCTVTARWIKLPERSEDGFYLIHNDQELQDIITYTNVFIDDNQNHLDTNIRLMADVNMGSDCPRLGVHREYDRRYTGMFDGNHHTIHVKRDITENQRGGVFEYLQTGDGNPYSVKDLTVDGTITTSAHHTGGLVGVAWNNVIIQNCVNKIDIVTKLAGKNYLGGFVGQVYNNELVIRDCAFLGSITAAPGVKAGYLSGFIGEVSQYATVKNSLMAGKIEVTPTENWDKSDYILYVDYNDHITIKDVYFLKDQLLINGQPKETSIYAQPLTAEQLASGEGCWMLAGKSNDPNAAWRQNLTEPKDAAPVPDQTHSPVFRDAAGQFTNTLEQYEVTFKIVGGHWGTDQGNYSNTADKKAYVRPGEKLTQEQVPAEMMVNPGYAAEGAAWNADPLQAELSGNTTFTYSFPKLDAEFLNIALRPGTGTGEMAPVEFRKDANYQLPEPAFTAPANEKFRGWKVFIDGVHKQYYDGSNNRELFPVGTIFWIDSSNTEVEIVAQWGHFHKDPYKLYTPVSTLEELQTKIEESYGQGDFYVTADLELGELSSYNKSIDLCLNGKQVTGSLAMSNNHVSDCTGKGVLTGAGGPVVRMSKGSWFSLRGGTIRQSAAIAEPVVKLPDGTSSKDIWIDEGTILQEADAPAIYLGSPITEHFRLNRGTIQTAGQPALEFGPGGDGRLMLGNAFVLDVSSETAAQIKVSKPGQISAQMEIYRNNGTVVTPYTGAVIRIDASDLKTGDAVVVDVTPASADRFVLTDPQYTLFLDGTDLRMVQKDATAGTASFEIGSARGTKPEDLRFLKGNPITLPMGKDLFLNGKSLVGWSDGVKSYAPGERYVSSPDQEQVTFTALWGRKHLHPGEETHNDEEWHPLYSGSYLNDPSNHYFYLEQDGITDVSDFTGRTEWYHLCLNGKTLSGSLLAGKRTSFDPWASVLIRDDHSGTGKVTAADQQPIVFQRDQTETWVKLQSGTVERTAGTVAGPVIGNFTKDSRIYISGGVMDQQSDAPAIVLDGQYAQAYISGGTVRTTGKPAVELTDAWNNCLYLSGTPVLDCGAGSAHIKPAKKEQIFAKEYREGGDIPYMGEKLLIDCSNLKLGDIVVAGVTSENWDRFEAADPDRVLALRGSNLILAEKVDSGMLTFRTTGATAGKAPVSFPGYQGVVTYLPMGKDLRKGDQVLIGWNSGTQKYFAGENYTPDGKNVTFTPIWGTEHTHEGSSSVWRPLYSENALQSGEQYLYAAENLKFPEPVQLGGSYRYLCLNGKTVEGSLKIQQYDFAHLNISDVHGGGKLLSTDAPALDYGGVWRDGYGSKLESGTLERAAGSAAGPVVTDNKSYGNFYLSGGTVEQKSDSAAIVAESSGSKIYLSGGTIHTAGKPAVEFRGGTANSNTHLYLSGTPTITVDNGGAHLKPFAGGQISAAEGGTPYTGAPLIIDCSNLRFEDVVVQDVTAENKELFTVSDPAKVLKYNEAEKTLTLMPSGFKPSTITFDIGAADGTTGTAPAAVQGNTGVAFPLPGFEAFNRSGSIFVGWHDGKTLYQAGDLYTPTEAAHTLTAQWHALNTDENGFITIGSLADLKSFILYFERQDQQAKGILTADLTMDNDCPRIGSWERPYRGQFDGDGYTITVRRTLTKGETSRGGVFDILGDNAAIFDLNVTGEIITAAMQTGGVVGETTFDAGHHNEIKLDRCHSSVNIRSSAGEDARAAGFFGRTNGAYLTDCWYSGTITAEPGTTDCHGFVGFNGGWDRNYLQMQGCLMTGQINGIPGDVNAFITTKAIYEVNHNTHLVNCSYLKRDGLTETHENVHAVTEAQLASGEVCRSLNGNQENGAGTWTQTLGSDPLPVYTAGHERVLVSKLSINGGKWADGTTAEKKVYLNVGDTISAPEGMTPNDKYGFGAWEAVGYNDPTKITDPLTEDKDFLYDYQQTVDVTFKVVNGTWENGGTEDVVVTIIKGHTLDPKSVPGIKPNKGFGLGSWSPRLDQYLSDYSYPSGIGSDMIFTYTYVKAHTVTFRIVNGTWNGSYGSGDAGHTAQEIRKVFEDGHMLTSSDYPDSSFGEGHTPNEGYGAGRWLLNGKPVDENDAPVYPSDDVITEDAVYTYEFRKILNVTFKIVNGSWYSYREDTADKIVQIPQGMTLRDSDVPKEMSTKAGFGEGSWDRTPSLTEPVMEDLTYTYSFKAGWYVTFSVSNGTWEDGESTWRCFVEEGNCLTAEQIPDVSKATPGENHDPIGAWEENLVPDTTTPITKTTYYTYAFKRMAAAGVTLKVSGGTWSDGTTKDQFFFVYLPMADNQTTYLTADQVPTGMTANDGHDAIGHWMYKGEIVEDITKVPITNGWPEFTFTFDPAQEATVTFRVENGKWKDGTEADSVVKVQIPMDLNGKRAGHLTEAQIPVDMTANDHYEGGRWVQVTDSGETAVTPTAQMEITGDVTFKYVYAPVIATAEVTFRVANGTWGDGTDGDKQQTIVTTAGVGHLTEKQIPVGMKASQYYEEKGQWLTEDGEAVADLTQADVTGNVTFIYTFAPVISSTEITFKVVNGTWGGGSTEKTVTVTTTAGKGTLSESQVPADMQPNAHYSNGHWNVEPNTAENGVTTEPVTYTYTYEAVVSTTKITFRVVNGIWGDVLNSEDKVVEVTTVAGKGTLDAKLVPTGMLDIDHFENGAWDQTPNTEENGVTTEPVTYTYTFQPMDTATVTFEVVHGKWADGKTEPITATVYLPMADNKVGHLKQIQIPDGMQPDEHYTGGSWNTDLLQAAITKDVTFTFTFGKDNTAEITFDVGGGSGTAPDAITGQFGTTVTLPTGDGLTKTGSVLVGWSDGAKTCAAGADFLLPEGKYAYKFTAVWMEQNSSGFLQLKNAKDFADFAVYVSGGAADAKAVLTADITLDADAQRIGTGENPFSGEFDGGGHIITANRTVTTDNCGGVFDFVGAASIHNLTVNGKITTTAQSTGGLFGTAAGADGTLTVKDCLFTGTITVETGASAGMFGGSAEKAVRLENCLMTGRLDGTNAQDFVPGDTVTAVNCCAADTFVGSKTEGVTAVTAAQLASGEVTHSLNDGRLVWTQNLPEDKLPTLNTRHKTVRKITFEVVNGTLDESVKTLYVNDGKLTAEQIETVRNGMTPAENTRGRGAWDKDPADANIQRDYTFTFTFEKIWGKDAAQKGKTVTLTFDEDLGAVTVIAATYDENDRLIAIGTRDVERAVMGGKAEITLEGEGTGTKTKLFLLNQTEKTPLRQEIVIGETANK